MAINFKPTRDWAWFHVGFPSDSVPLSLLKTQKKATKPQKLTLVVSRFGGRGPNNHRILNGVMYGSASLMAEHK